jgi:hypothetical protein
MESDRIFGELVEHIINSMVCNEPITDDELIESLKNIGLKEVNEIVKELYTDYKFQHKHFIEAIDRCIKSSTTLHAIAEEEKNIGETERITIVECMRCYYRSLTDLAIARRQIFGALFVTNSEIDASAFDFD